MIDSKRKKQGPVHVRMLKSLGIVPLLTVLAIAIGIVSSVTAVSAQTPHPTPTATGSAVQLTTGDIMATARSQPTVLGTPIQHPNRKPDRGSLPQNPASPDQFPISNRYERLTLIVITVFIVTLILMGRGVFFNFR
jgi:hypothetical protein